MWLQLKKDWPSATFQRSVFTQAEKTADRQFVRKLDFTRGVPVEIPDGDADALAAVERDIGNALQKVVPRAKRFTREGEPGEGEVLEGEPIDETTHVKTEVEASSTEPPPINQPPKPETPIGDGLTGPDAGDLGPAGNANATKRGGRR